MLKEQLVFAAAVKRKGGRSAMVDDVALVSEAGKPQNGGSPTQLAGAKSFSARRERSSKAVMEAHWLAMVVAAAEGGCRRRMKR
jgi:hypothetical protein